MSIFNQYSQEIIDFFLIKKVFFMDSSLFLSNVTNYNKSTNLNSASSFEEISFLSSKAEYEKNKTFNMDEAKNQIMKAFKLEMIMNILFYDGGFFSVGNYNDNKIKEFTIGKGFNLLISYISFPYFISNDYVETQVNGVQNIKLNVSAYIRFLKILLFFIFDLLNLIIIIVNFLIGRFFVNIENNIIPDKLLGLEIYILGKIIHFKDHNTFKNYKEIGYLFNIKDQVLFAIGLRLSFSLYNLFFNYPEAIRYKTIKKHYKFNIYQPNIHLLKFFRFYLDILPNLSNQSYIELRLGINFAIIWPLIFYMSKVYNYKYHKQCGIFYGSNLVLKSFK